MAQEYKLILSISATISTPRQLICQELRAAGALRASVSRAAQRTRATRLWPGATGVAASSAMGNSIVPPPRLRVRRHGSSAATAYAQARFTNLKQQAEAPHQTANAAKKKPQTRPVPDGCSEIALIALRLWYCRRGKGRYCPSGNVCWTVPAAVAGIENGDERLL
jgi:hypothetical protein